MKLSIKGFDSLVQGLQELQGEALDGAIKDKLAECINDVRDDAEALAPQATKAYTNTKEGKAKKTVRHEPGRLKKSLKARMFKKKTSDVGGGVYADYPGDDKDANYYAFAPEYGTTHGGWRHIPSRPKPFLRAALLKNENNIVSKVSQAVEIAINRVMYGKSRLSSDEVTAIENQFGGNVTWRETSVRDMK